MHIRGIARRDGVIQVITKLITQDFKLSVLDLSVAIFVCLTEDGINSLIKVGKGIPHPLQQSRSGVPHTGNNDQLVQE